MAGNRRGRNPPEYRQRIVELVWSGRSPRPFAGEFEQSDQTIWIWVRRADLDEGRRSDGLTSKARGEATKAGQAHSVKWVSPFAA